MKKSKKNGMKKEKLAKKKASFHRGNPRPSSGPPRAEDAVAGEDSPSSASAEPCRKMVVLPRVGQLSTGRS